MKKESNAGGRPTRKRTAAADKATKRITMPDEVDLSAYNSLDIVFKATLKKRIVDRNVHISGKTCQILVRVVESVGYVTTRYLDFAHLHRSGVRYESTSKGSQAQSLGSAKLFRSRAKVSATVAIRRDLRPCLKGLVSSRCAC